MSSVQKHYLTLFNDNSIIPESVLESEQSYLSIVSHNIGTSPFWLLNSLIENGLIGTASAINKELCPRSTQDTNVVFISFLNNEDFYVSNSKKSGIDLLMNLNFKFIDLFLNLFSKRLKDSRNASQDVETMFDEVKKVIQSCQHKKRIVFIESPEFLLSSTNLAPNQLVKHLFEINKLCNLLVVIAAQDSPQFVNTMAYDHNDPSFKITDFLLKLYHRSNININMQPLPTGRAKDITGCLTVTKGSRPFEIPGLKVYEKEYMYHIGKELGIDIYMR